MRAALSASALLHHVLVVAVFCFATLDLSAATPHPAAAHVATTVTVAPGVGVAGGPTTTVSANTNQAIASELRVEETVSDSPVTVTATNSNSSITTNSSSSSSSSSNTITYDGNIPLLYAESGVTTLPSPLGTHLTFYDIVKATEDNRNYRSFSLPNGIDVIVVQDRNTAMAACAVDVNTGWWHDPEGASGLNHFMEHMLFLGNAKYPHEGDFRSFINSRGGSSNAYTSSNDVNFYFDVGADSLEEGLDRFSQFFVSPLLTKSATSREIHAINAEHVRNLQRDVWRIQQLWGSLANASIPYHKFSTGSLKTLGVLPPDDLHEQLVSLTKRVFIGPNLRVAIVGSDSIDDLQAMAVKYFSVIPATVPQQSAGDNNNNNNQQATTTSTQPQQRVLPAAYPYEDRSNEVYDSSLKGSIVYVKTVKFSRVLVMNWCIPPQTPNYANKSIEFISELLGRGGRGSLSYILKHKRLSREVSVGVAANSAHFDHFQIEVSLTGKGFTDEGVREVITTTMRYIKFIETSALDEWRWRELGRIMAIHFRLQPKVAVSDLASRLAAHLPRHRRRDILTYSFLFESFDKAGVQSLLARLTPDNMVAMLQAHRHRVPLTKTEQWYGTKYAVSGLNIQSFIEARQAAITPEETGDSQFAMTLPGPNAFFPSSLAIKPPAKPSMPRTFPLIIYDRVNASDSQLGSVRVWYHQDGSFHRPRVNIVCKFWSPSLYSSPRAVVMAALYTKAVRDVLSDVSYSADVAGYSFYFSSALDGFNMRVHSYDSGLAEYLSFVAQYIQFHVPGTNSSGNELSPTRFQLVKDELLQAYRNFMFGQPIGQASYLLSGLLAEPHWHVSEYINALEGIELDDMLQWQRTIYQDVSLECLANGNLYEKEAIQAVASIARSVTFRSNTQFSRSISSQGMRIVQLDGAYAFADKSANPQDQNSAAYTYYQFEGEGNLNDDLYIQLLRHMIRKPCFHQLRTKEALGYLVFSGSMNREGVNGMRIGVQSPKRTAGYLDWRIDYFMSHFFRRWVYNMPRERFFGYLQGLANSKYLSPATLSGQTAIFWREIRSQKYEFNRAWKASRALRGMTLKMFLQFYDELIGVHDAPSRISIQVNAQTGPGSKAVLANGTVESYVVSPFLPEVNLNDVDDIEPDVTQAPIPAPTAAATAAPTTAPVVAPAATASPSSTEAPTTTNTTAATSTNATAAHAQAPTNASASASATTTAADLSRSDPVSVLARALEHLSGSSASSAAAKVAATTTTAQPAQQPHATWSDYEYEVEHERPFGFDRDVDMERAERQALPGASDVAFLQFDEDQEAALFEPHELRPGNDLYPAEIVDEAESQEERRQFDAAAAAADVATSEDTPTPVAAVETASRTRRVARRKRMMSKQQIAGATFVPAGDNPQPRCPAKKIMPTRTVEVFCNGTIIEYENRGCNSIDCAPVDTTCNKSGPRKIYWPRVASNVNLMAFKNGACLFPKRPVGTFLPTKNMWLRVRARLAAIRARLAALLRQRQQQAAQMASNSTATAAPAVSAATGAVSRAHGRHRRKRHHRHHHHHRRRHHRNRHLKLH